VVRFLVVTTARQSTLRENEGVHFPSTKICMQRHGEREQRRGLVHYTVVRPAKKKNEKKKKGNPKQK
jgi:hypothetical protein